MKTSKEIMTLLGRLKGALKDQYHVERLGVFGSYVNGTQRADSDLDILVEFDRPIGLFAFVSLRDYLASEAGLPVDLVMKRALRPFLRERILREVRYV